MEPIEAEVATLTDGRVDGALLLRDVDDPLAPALRRRGFPAVLMFTPSDDPEQWFVDCDNRRLQCVAARVEYDLGSQPQVEAAGHAIAHRDDDLAFVRLPPCSLPNGDARRDLR